MDDHQRTISSGGARQGIVDSRAVIQHMIAAYPPLFFSARKWNQLLFLGDFLF